MRTYQLLSRLPFLRSYVSKFLFIAFVGIHVPLISLGGYLLFYQTGVIPKRELFIWLLVFTLLATIVSLFIIHQLLQPIHLLHRELINFNVLQRPPQLPIAYNDEVGTLMRDMQVTLTDLHALEEERTNIVASLSHDLRSPISTILGLGEYIMRTTDDPQLREASAAIMRLSKRQIRLADQMLSSMKEGGLGVRQLEQAPASVYRLLAQAVENNDYHAKSKNVTVHNKIAEDVQVYVHANMLVQALSNLINNAIKFSYPNSDVLCMAFVEDQEVAIEIIDDGVGLEGHTLDTLFTRFNTDGRTGTSGEKSTGFGLYASKQILERNGGSLTAVSGGKNQGSTFIIRLPHHVPTPASNHAHYRTQAG